MPTHHNLIRHWRFVLYICEGIFLKMLPSKVHGIYSIQIKVYNITLIYYIYNILCTYNMTTEMKVHRSKTLKCFFKCFLSVFQVFFKYYYK